MDVLKVVEQAKREYDEWRLKRFRDACNLPPGCQIQMQLGTGIVEIICDSKELARHLWRNYPEYLSLEFLAMERLDIKARDEGEGRNPASVERLLAVKKSYEDAMKRIEENG